MTYIVLAPDVHLNSLAPLRAATLAVVAKQYLAEMNRSVPSLQIILKYVAQIYTIYFGTLLLISSSIKITYARIFLEPCRSSSCPSFSPKISPFTRQSLLESTRIRAVP